MLRYSRDGCSWSEEGKYCTLNWLFISSQNWVPAFVHIWKWTNLFCRSKRRWSLQNQILFWSITVEKIIQAFVLVSWLVRVLCWPGQHEFNGLLGLNSWPSINSAFRLIQGINFATWRERRGCSSKIQYKFEWRPSFFETFKNS